MFQWRAWTRAKEEVFQFTTILISLITIKMMKQKVLRKCMTPAEYQRLPGGEAPGK